MPTLIDNPHSHLSAAREKALRAVAVHAVDKAVVARAVPAGHRFYFAFETGFPGASVPESLRERFPDQMTILLQSSFWDLVRDEDGFAVTLSFGSAPQRLRIPFLSIRTFTDPDQSVSVQYPQAWPGALDDELALLDLACRLVGPAPAEGLIDYERVTQRAERAAVLASIRRLSEGAPLREAESLHLTVDPDWPGLALPPGGDGAALTIGGDSFGFATSADGFSWQNPLAGAAAACVVPIWSVRSFEARLGDTAYALAFAPDAPGTAAALPASEAQAPPARPTLLDRLIALSGHHVHTLKAKDSNDRPAYYFVYVHAGGEREFLSAINGEGTTDLELFGKVLASNFGDEPTPEIKSFLKSRYAFSV